MKFAVSMIFLFWQCFAAMAQYSPSEQQWLQFISRVYRPGVVASGKVIGKLVDRKNLSMTLKNVLDFCDRFFDEMAKKGIPADLFWPPLEVPLKKEFENVLGGFRLKLSRRYGVPVQNDKRVRVPVKVMAGEEPRYGYLYLIMENEKWYLEQMKLNLEGMPMEPLPEEKPQKISGTDS